VDWYAREVGLRIGGHRGDPETTPENTLVAFDAAVALGVDYIETDVQRTADGVLVLLHDDDLDRTTNGSGPVAEALAEDVLALDAGSWYEPKFSDQRVLTAEAFIDWVEERDGLGAEIDIKATGIGAPLAERISRSPAKDRFALCSSLADELASAKTTYPGLACFLILDYPDPDPIEQVRACGADGADLPWDWLDEELIGRMRRLGVAIMGSTASEEAEVRALLRLNADFVDSDRPRLALALRSEFVEAAGQAGVDSRGEHEPAG
jgi:glycerophosphoryl diester phosphodiesterase